MRGSNGKLWFSEKERGKVWKGYMKRNMNEDNDLDHNVEGDVVEGTVVCLSRKNVLQALNEMKTVKAPRPSEAASRRVDIQVMVEICQKFLH